MLRYLADVNFRGPIYRGLMRQNPHIPIQRAVDLGYERDPDETLLRRAREAGQILLTHDMKTMPGAAIAVPDHAGIFIVNPYAQTGPTIEELELLAICTEPTEWVGTIHYLGA